MVFLLLQNYLFAAYFINLKHIIKMNPRILCSAFFLLLFTITTSAQDLVGRKIVNANLYLNAVFADGSRNSSYTGSVLFGKVKSDNTYLAFGAVLDNMFIQNYENDMVNFGPAIEYGKFVKLVDKFYIAPVVGGSIQGVFGDTPGVKANIYAVPIRIMYDFTNHFMLSASFGSVNLSTISVKRFTNINLSGSLTNNSSFGVFYTFK